MARPRTASEVLELKGSFKKHPDRKRDRLGEPKPAGELGDPPLHLSDQEKACWHELSMLAPPRVLTNAERWWVEMSCRLMAKFRSHVITNAELSQLVILLSRMGLNPSDRSKIGLPENAKEANPFEEIASDLHKPN